MSEVKLWILLSVVGVLMSVCGFGLKAAVSYLGDKLDEIVRELKVQSTISTRHEGEIAVLKRDQANLCSDYDDLEERVRDVENNQRFLMHGSVPAETL